MRNLPEKDLWTKIKTRLEHYLEEPDDDDWRKIASAIPSAGNSPAVQTSLASRMVPVVAVVLFLLLPFQAGVKERLSDDFYVLPHIAGITGMDALDAQRIDSDQEALIVTHNSVNIIKGKGERRDVGISRVSYSRRIVNELETLHSPLKGNNKLPEVAAIVDVQEVVAREGRWEKGAIDALSIDSLTEEATDCDTTITKAHTVKKSDPKKKRKFKPSIYFLATPSLAYQKIIPRRYDEVVIHELNSQGIFSAARRGLSLEAGFQAQVMKDIELYGSLSYYYQQQSVLYTYQSRRELQVEHNSDPLSYTILPGIATREFAYAMQNVGTSLGFLYHIKGDKLMHKAGGGLQYQKGFLTAGGDDSYDNSASGYLNYQLLYRLEFVLRAKAHFFVQPTFVHAMLSKERLQEPFNMKPYRAGLGFGVVYHFR